MISLILDQPAVEYQLPERLSDRRRYRDVARFSVSPFARQDTSITLSIDDSLDDLASLLLSDQCESASTNDLLEQISAAHSRQQLLTRVREAIDSNAAHRLDMFIDYRPGWDHGSGKALSIGSLNALRRFIDAESLDERDASLFMSHDGNVVLNWRSRRGHLIEVEFLPDSVVIFSAADDVERELPLDLVKIREQLTHLV
jgi:hypothetical protein